MSLSTESNPTPVREGPPPSVITLTPNAVEQIKRSAEKIAVASGKFFRVYVEGGGCSGMQYGFSFDQKKEDDFVVHCGTIDVLVDPQSSLYLKGSTVDYVEDLRGSGFTVKNPNSKGACGCGVSFTV